MQAISHLWNWTWRSQRETKKQVPIHWVYKPYQHLQISASSCWKKCFTLTYKQPEATRYFRKASNMKNGNKSNKGKSRITIPKRKLTSDQQAFTLIAHSVDAHSSHWLSSEMLWYPGRETHTQHLHIPHWRCLWRLCQWVSAHLSN